MNKNGMTLVEIMLSVAVIGILSAGVAAISIMTTKQKSNMGVKREQLDYDMVLFSRLKDPALCTDAIDKTVKFDLSAVVSEGQEINFQFSNHLSLNSATEINSQVQVKKSFLTNAIKVEEISQKSTTSDFYLTDVKYDSEIANQLSTRAVAKILVEVDKSSQQIKGCNGMNEDPNKACSVTGKIYFGNAAACPDGSSTDVNGCCASRFSESVASGGTSDDACQSTSAALKIGESSYTIKLVQNPVTNTCDCPVFNGSTGALSAVDRSGGKKQCVYTCNNSNDSPYVRVKLLTDAAGNVSNIENAVECGFCKDLSGWQKYTDAENKWCYYGKYSQSGSSDRQGALVLSNLEAYKKYLEKSGKAKELQELNQTVEVGWNIYWQEKLAADAASSRPKYQMPEPPKLSRRSGKLQYTNLYGNISHGADATKAYKKDVKTVQDNIQGAFIKYTERHIASTFTPVYDRLGLSQVVPTPSGPQNLEAPFYACDPISSGEREFNHSGGNWSSTRSRVKNINVVERATYYQCYKEDMYYCMGICSDGSGSGGPSAGGGGGWN